MSVYDELNDCIESAWSSDSCEYEDGTGYVKLTDYEQLKEFARDACTVLRGFFDPEWFDETVFAERMHELGIEIEVDDD